MAEGNILLIDDELMLCEFLRDLLKDRGYDVSYVQSGGEGIKAFQEGSFNVVMTDLKMPDIDGIQVIEKIREIDPDSVVIVMTGYPSFETVQLSMRLGIYDYITKPFNIKEVSFLIKRAVAFRNLTFTNKRLVKELEEQNTKLEKKVKERTKELILIYKIGQEISSTLELDKVLQSIVDKLSMILGLEICAILLVDASGRLSIKSAQGLDSSCLSQTSIKPGEEISGWVWEKKEAVLLNDIDSDSRFADRKQERCYVKSLVSVPLIFKDKFIGVINISNKKSQSPFNDYDLRLVKEIATEAAIAIENANLFQRLQDVYMRTVSALAAIIDAKDHYTRSHSENVTRYAVAIAKEMKLSSEQVRHIRSACQLHDLGKIGIHDYILTKPGKLTPEEWEEIKLHSLRGAELLAPLDFMDGITDMVKQHHERYDGKGYPDQLDKEKIKLGARIMAVADSFDAMVSERPYRKGFPLEKAIEELKRCKGTQFDPEIVDVFLKVLDKNPHIIPIGDGRQRIKNRRQKAEDRKSDLWPLTSDF